MESLIQRWIQLGPFFQNQGTFFYFQKRAGKASPPLPLVARLHRIVIPNKVYFFVFKMFKVSLFENTQVTR